MTPLLVCTGINYFHVESKPAKHGSLVKKYTLFARWGSVLFIELLFVTNDSCFIYIVNQYRKFKLKKCIVGSVRNLLLDGGMLLTHPDIAAIMDTAM